MQNNRTTCLETFEKVRFSSFPQSLGDATGKPATRDKTRGCRKTSISCETSSNFDIFDTLSNRLECHKVPRLARKTTWQPAWKHSKRTGFAASPIDMATPQDNERLATRHVDAEKPAFCARLPAISTVGNMTKGQVTKGSVSYLSSPCFSTSLGGIGGPAHGIHGILAVMYWISIIRGGPPPKMVMGSIPTGDAVTGPHIRGTLSMREMSL